MLEPELGFGTVWRHIFRVRPLLVRVGHIAAAAAMPHCGFEHRGGMATLNTGGEGL